MTTVKPARGALRRTLERALRATDKEPRDMGTVELARSYADALDQGAALWAAAVELVESCRREGDDIGRASAQKLASALHARHALADLGPKYLAALAALNLTTASRASQKDGPRDDTDPAAAALVSLQARSRQRDTAAVDSPTPSAHP